MVSWIPWRSGRSGSPAILYGENGAVQRCYNPSPMSATAHFARRFRFLELLRGSLALGALYDCAFAVLMVAAPGLPARWLGLPLPPLPRGAFYLWVMAVLLAMLSYLYLLAA